MSDDTSSSAIEAPGPLVKRWPWGPSSSVLVVVVAFLIAQLLGGVLVALYPSVHHWNSVQANRWLTNSVGAQFSFVLISETITLLILWFYLRHRITRKQLGLTSPSWYDPLFSIIAIVVYYGSYLLVVAVVTSIVSINTGQQQNIGFN